MSLNNPDKYINRLKDKFPTIYQEALDKQTDPVHIAYILINHDVELNNVPWNKCLDCGQPYVIGEDGGASTFCSYECETKTRRYMETGNLDQD